MLTSEVLDKAADEIQRRGWVQAGDVDKNPWGGGANSDKPLCLEGGIAAAMGFVVDSNNTSRVEDYTSLLSCSAFRALNAYLHPDIDINVLYPRKRPYDYNDDPGRTMEEVIAVLRATAAVERVKEASTIELTASVKV